MEKVSFPIKTKIVAVVTILGGIFFIFFSFLFSVGISIDIVNEELAGKAFEEKMKKGLKIEDCLGFSESGKEICFRNLAVQEKNKELCKDIKEKDRRRSCELDITILTRKNLASCEKFLTFILSYAPEDFGGENWEKKEECVRDVAIESSDIELCNLLDEGRYDFRRRCIDEIIYRGEISDFRVCEEMASKETKEICFTTVAVNKDDLKMCKELGGSYYTDCYIGIAVKRNDPDICRMIPEGWWDRDKCFKKVEGIE